MSDSHQRIPFSSVLSSLQKLEHTINIDQIEFISHPHTSYTLVLTLLIDTITKQINVAIFYSVLVDMPSAILEFPYSMYRLDSM